MELTRAIFGYNSTEVKREINSLKGEVDDSLRRCNELEHKIAHLAAENEELKVTVAALRRQRVEIFGQGRALQPLSIMVGPTDRLGAITNLIDSIEEISELNIHFRVFRDGFYRVDGYTYDKLGVAEWFQSRNEFRNVVVSDDNIHVTPKGIV